MASRREAETAVEEVIADGTSRMTKAVEHLERELASMRTGRATPALVENVMIDYYGAATPLGQLATITAPEARLLVVQPWDKQAIQSIEKGLLKSDVGVNPASDGNVIRIVVPPLTQERRREIVRVLRRKVEDARVAVRNVRRDVIERLRAMEKEKQLSQDESRRAQDRLQKVTDSHIDRLDNIGSAKEAEVMQV